MSKALRALVIASSSEDAEPLSNELIRAGYNLVSAHVNTRDSMDQALRDENWDVILSQYSIPDFGALAALALLRERGDDIPFLVIFERIDAEAAIYAVKAGAHDCIPKGSLDRLAPSVERELKEAEMRRGQALGRKVLRESEARMRETLLEYATRFRAVTESWNGLIYEWNIRNGSLAWFTDIDEKLGYAPGEFPRTREAWERILHPDDHDRVVTAVERHLRTGERFSEEYRVMRRDGTPIAWSDSGKVVRDIEGTPNRWVGVVTDVTESRHFKEQVQYLAVHDVLTGLPNRALFNDRLTVSLAQAKRGDQKLAILFLNLDRFSAINESFGYSVGDQFLCRVAERIRAGIRAGDTVARFGGDEFAILSHGIRSEADAAKIAQKIVEATRLPFSVGQRELFITTSIGVSIYPTDGSELETLSRNANAALRRVKEQGRDNYQLYSPEMNARAVERLSLENRLRQALQNEQFVLYYQPLVDLHTERIVGAEALLRWLHPELGLLSPGDFIPMAEMLGLMMTIGQWVLNASCEQVRDWRDTGYPDFRVAVNVSPRQFQQPDFVAAVSQALEESRILPESLDLEIAESTVMRDPERSVATLQDLKKKNVRISLDDFGTGFASLNYLGLLPIDRIKLDASFVHELQRNSNHRAIARAVIGMAHGLRLTILAEGVETAEQLAFLRDEGCDEAQGYFFGRPLPAPEFRAFLERKSRAIPRP